MRDYNLNLYTVGLVFNQIDQKETVKNRKKVNSLGQLILDRYMNEVSVRGNV